MHDVTEGGLATALLELSTAGRRRLRVYRDRIAILPETERVCGILKLNPLGLIGSGSLLIVCDSGQSGNIVRALQSEGIRVHNIGVVMGDGVGIEAFAGQGGARITWPQFEVDEIARLFQERT
jgi:hydrogenase maturation factor